MKTESLRKSFVGAVFGRLKIVKDAPDKILPSGKRTSRMMECQCECGNTIVTYLHSLKAGDVSSCGCLARELSSIRNSTHGMSKTSEYETWSAMCKRGRGNRDQKRYRDRGIYVCDRWMTSFENFISDMGLKPSPELSIDRIDNSKGYFPENCRWATYIQQCRNKEKTLYVTFQGERKVLRELTESFGLDHSAIRGRLRLGWSVEDALTIPVNKMKPRKKQHANL